MSGGGRRPTTMTCSRAMRLAAFVLLVAAPAAVRAELTPPYFNLAEGRKISATATCGVETEEPELYCKLVGANTENYNHSRTLIQGQVCDYCDPTVPDRSHPPEHAIDGTSNWWQSPPLSRGMKYNEVNLTIDFGQEFHVAYLFIRMGNSPRPGLWTLEKSSDYGQTWTSWQHFSDSPNDCDTYFGKDSLKPITRDDDVICTTEYSKIVPLEDGEIPVMLLNNRPSSKNYFNSTVLQEWTRATNVRFRFLRTKNLLGHLMSVARQDPTVTRRYFYSIRDISIGGRCMCNGHADTCDWLDQTPLNRVLACQCQHHTCGIQCAECCPGFVQKKWRQNTNARPFQCEACNCFDHSSTCVYDEEVDAKRLSLDIHGRYEGGGVCQNCKHNTRGINCNQCKDRFYRPAGRHWNESTVCQPCDCDRFYSTGNCEEETGRCECGAAYAERDCQSCSYGHFGFPNCRPCTCNLNGTEGYHCEPEAGRCPCRENFGGEFCQECAAGYYGLPECTECGCNELGALDQVCAQQSGQCECRSNFDGRTCDRCKDGYWNYPQCLYCDCDVQGTVGEVCGKESGQCICKEGFGGPRCDQCLPGYFNYPNCQPCGCSTVGSSSTTCDATGRCLCLPSFAGKQCTQCSTGHYAFPDCLACNCEAHGAVGISCNNDGQCSCSPNFDGKTCNQCKEGFYNFPACEGCNCDPAGVIAKFAGCGSVPAGQLCQCKQRVTGRICNECKPQYWNLNVSNPDGCEECECSQDGTIGNLDTCSSRSGQCPCKPNVAGRRCDECRDGSFDLSGEGLFGCTDCGCDIGGSISTVCDKRSGQCRCHPRVAGRTCSSPLTMHYFPTLYHNQFEYEDGYTPSGADVRYLYDEELFPGFSKRGYAKFSTLQSEVKNEVSISKSSVYRMVIRYVNPTQEPVVATILITSDNPTEADQEAKVLFKPTTEPQFVTVSGARADFIAPIVLDGGRYEFAIRTDHFLYLDYFVLLPQAYYEGTRLTKKIVNPCELGSLGLCRHYKYPNIVEYIPSYEPFVRHEDDTSSSPAVYYEDAGHLQLLGERRLPSLTGAQPQLTYIVNVPQAGPYVVIVDYVTERGAEEPTVVTVRLVGDASDEDDGRATLYTCTYTTVCRTPVIDADSKEKVFELDPNNVRPLEIVAQPDALAAIKSIAIVPLSDWSVDLITPAPVCVMQNGHCVQTNFLPAANSKKAEFETENEDRVTGTNPAELYDNATRLIYLDLNDPTVTIHARVPGAGAYHILVQYFQPNHHEFAIDYAINDQPATSGKLPLKNCPSNAGCRVLIRPNDQSLWFGVDEENVTIAFTNHLQKGVWLDYVMFVPVSDAEPAYAVVDKLLHEEPFDQTKEFIQQCGQNHFHIQLNASEFCKQAVFSLTSDYNHGALPCHCNYDGSNSFECDPFGGQCQCRENVIGRQCDACRTGFYGFPDCKPCNCPSTALCEKETGQCICPPRVTGDKCDKCEPYTFGFDQIVGCELCNCQAEGVQNSDLQCDLFNGTCACRANIEGRACDKCVTGYYDYPHCKPCRCDHAGTTYDICNQQDESCLCKKNVRGLECNECTDGTYNLQPANPDGCTKCFCFGKTSRCERAFLRPFTVGMHGQLEVATFNATQQPTPDAQWRPWLLPEERIAVNDSLLEIDFGQHEPTHEALVYFGMLEHWKPQRHHLMAYGGRLRYQLFYTTGLFGDALYGPDVVLESSDGRRIMHTSYEQPASGIPFSGAVEMLESQFRTATGGPVTRESFMETLRDLRRIWIRATYWESTVVARLSDVSLTIADEDPANHQLYEELPIERCACPVGYDGYSCEECAAGYYRDPNGPHGGYCKRCECNGHATTCDCQTGVCHDCAHSTTGDHCERCIVGYHGNATQGTPGDCMICACPLPVGSNNFATACEISEDGSQIECQCEEGYAGARCQSCAAGYFGQPEVEGEICRPCNCSGNIDASDANACDSVTGDCLQCLHNTFGTACNLCAPGFYGDAVLSKNCQTCICDADGTADCDNYVGHCNCRENVIGEKCDRCEPDHYGFHSGRGCAACDCGAASDSRQCDDQTGECRCRPGVTGRQCDRCARGFWNYTEAGCETCACNTEYSRGSSCNVETGQCECLPGVVGEKCDKCPWRWVLLQDEGCQECGVCHHALLDVTDAMRAELDPVVEEFGTTARGYYTAQKLVYLNESVDALEPLVKALDPHSVNLAPLRQRIEHLEGDLKSANRRIQYADQRAGELALSGGGLLNESRAVLERTREVAVAAQLAIDEVEQLAESFDTAESTKLDTAVAEAGDIVQDLLAIQAERQTRGADLVAGGGSGGDLADVHAHLASVREQLEPVQLQVDGLSALRTNIGAFSDKMENLLEWSAAANGKSAETRAVLDRYRNATANSKFETVRNQTAETEANIEQTVQDASRGNITLEEIDRHVAKLSAVHASLEPMNARLEDDLPEPSEDAEALQQQADAARHSEQLVSEARDLDADLSDITADSEKALRAATSYSDIVEAVHQAQTAIGEAEQASGNATALCDGIGERASRSDHGASRLLDEAREALSHVQARLQPHLNASADAVQLILDTNNASHEKLNAIDRGLDALTAATPVSDVWQQSLRTAVDANAKATEALHTLKPIAEALPAELDRAKQLPKQVDDTNKDTARTNTQVERVQSLIPELDSLIGEMERKQDETKQRLGALGVEEERLREQIAQARELANSIRVGVDFQPSTTLELKLPSNIAQQAVKSNVDFYVKTDKPDGFLMYLGNENKTTGRRSRRNDFMAVEVQNGYPIVTIDIGDGEPQRIVGSTPIADGQWHHINVAHDGPDVTLTVGDEVDGKEQQHQTTGQLTGTTAIFQFDPEKTKLFVGGYPQGFHIQDGLNEASFEGQIENLRIGDQDVGLWNFVDAQDNVNGALERDRFVRDESQPNGYRFTGHGYVILNSKPFNFNRKSSIHFLFKVAPDVSDGLIFYAGKEDSYIAVELRNGGIAFRYKMGEHAVAFEANGAFNDDEWHKVEAERDGRNGVLRIDNVDFYQENAPAAAGAAGAAPVPVLEVSDSMYFGGYPGRLNHSELTEAHFEGCIKDVQVSGTLVHLTRNQKAYGVRPGCPEKVSNAIAFRAAAPGYLRRPELQVPDNNFEVHLKFRTQHADGLIFYGYDHNQVHTIGLALSDGQLVFNSGTQALSTEGDRFNDGQWHTVLATSNGANRRLRLIVDGAEESLYESAFDTEPLHIAVGEIYFGGLYAGFQPPRGAVASTAHFAGCISDVSIGRAPINFAKYTDKKNAKLDQCGADVFAVESPPATVTPPVAPVTINTRFNEIEPTEEQEQTADEREQQVLAAAELEEARRANERLAAEEQRARAEAESAAAAAAAEEAERRQKADAEAEEKRLRDELEKNSVTPKPALPPARPTYRPPKRPAERPDEPVCKLPVQPALEAAGFDAGYRLGSIADSRLEFMQTATKMKKHYDISLKFRTAEKDGLLFYAADSRHTDFVALYLLDGHVHHVFNIGLGRVDIQSRYVYDNSVWHTVVITRQQTKGQLIINGEDIEQGEMAAEHQRPFNVQAPFWFGGIDHEHAENMHTNLKLSAAQTLYRGCIADMQIGGKDLGVPAQMPGVLPCAAAVEAGVFFPGDGYVKLRERFRVGHSVQIDLEVRPRTQNALLLSVHGKKAMLFLELSNGAVNLTANDGDFTYSTLWQPDGDQNLCDGQWHSIKVLKSKFVITVQVDKVASAVGLGNAQMFDSHTARPLFLGGHQHMARARSINVRKPYVGCMRNVRINEGPTEEMTNTMVVGDVQTGVCPTV